MQHQIVGNKMIQVLKLGKIPWNEALQIQKRLVESKISNRENCDYLLFCQHHPLIYTMGKRKLDLSRIKPEIANLIVPSERGGQITCHNKGQLVIYPIVDLGFRGKSVRKYVEDLESVLIGSLKHISSDLKTKAENAGIWTTEDEKIASIGIQIRHWIGMHGASINVCNDLRPFREPELEICGEKNVKITSLKEKFGFSGQPEDLIEIFSHEFQKVFHTEIHL